MVIHVVIFGSTGVTGLCVTQASIEKGLKTRAFVRDPNKLPESLRDKVDIIQGDVLNYDDVLTGVKDTDRVIVTIGTRNDLSPTTVLSDGLRNIVKAMNEAKIEIVSVCLSAFLFFDLNSDLVPGRLKELTKEHTRMYDILRATDLKYIAVFPPHISHGAPTGYNVVLDKYVARKVSKYDLAQFLVDCLELTMYYRKVVGIGSKH